MLDLSRQASEHRASRPKRRRETSASERGVKSSRAATLAPRQDGREAGCARCWKPCWRDAPRTLGTSAAPESCCSAPTVFRGARSPSGRAFRDFVELGADEIVAAIREPFPHQN